MRQGWTVAPTGLSILLVVGLSGAGPDAPTPAVKVLDERFGIRTAPILLLARPDVQRDLQLDARQIRAAETAIARLVEGVLRLKGQTGPSVMARRGVIDEEMTQWLVGQLSKDQLERLRQIDLQWEGALAISRPVVAESLNLTDAQRLTVEHLLETQRRMWRDRGLLAPGERAHFSRQALAVLSPDQKALWDRLLGRPCRFAIGGQAAPPGNAAAAQRGLADQARRGP